MKGRLQLATAVALSLLWGCPGMAPPSPSPSPRPYPPGLDLQELAEGANLVIVGEVVDVLYRQSQPQCPGCQGVPFTLVTYRIDRVVSGEARDERLTLRLSGGADGRGGFLLFDNQPTVSVGDRDLLFVAENGAEGCPLVRCKRGRFRFLGGMVHDGSGVPLRRLDGARAVAAGEAAKELATITFPAPAFDALLELSPVQDWIAQSGEDVEVLREKYAAEAPPRMELSTARPAVDGDSADVPAEGAVASHRPPEARTTVLEETFVSAVEEIVARLQPPTLPVAFLEPREFSDAPLLASAVEPVLPADVVRAVRDDREVEAFERNDRNPVLGERPGG